MMMNDKFSNQIEIHKQAVKIWYCDGCAAVHLRVGEQQLNFDRAEFAEFTDAVVDIHCGGWWKPQNQNLSVVKSYEVIS